MLENNVEPDNYYLLADPISRKRNDLLWLNASQLEQIGQMLECNDQVTIDFHNPTRTHMFGRNDYEWAKSVEPLMDKAYSASLQNRLEESVKYYKEALSIAPGADLFLMSIGSAYSMMGDLERGLRFLLRAAEIGPDNSRIALNLKRTQISVGRHFLEQSENLLKTGCTRSAIDIIEKAVAILRPTEEIALLGLAMNSLGTALSIDRQFEHAMQAFQEAAHLITRQFGPDSSELARVLVNLGQTGKEIGNLSAAFNHLRRALSILERTGSVDSDILLLALDNLAECYQQIDDTGNALRHLDHARRIRATCPQERLSLVRTLRRMATALINSEGANEAEPLLMQALHLLDVAEEVDTIPILVDLARIKMSQGSLEAADELLTNVLGLEAKFGRCDSSSAAVALNNLGWVREARGFTSAALECYRDALRIKKSAPPHERIMALGNFASLAATVGNEEEAVDALKKMINAGQEHLRMLMSAGSEYQKRQILNTRAGWIDVYLDVALSIVNKSPYLLKDIYYTVLSWKGLLSRILASTREDGLFEQELLQLKGSLAALLLSSNWPIAVQHKSRIAHLYFMIEEREQAISQRLASFPRFPSPEELRRLLPPDAALIEYVEFTRTFITKGHPERVPWLVAFVVTSHNDILIRDLGAMKPIAQHVHNYRVALAADVTAIVNCDMQNLQIREERLGVLAAQVSHAILEPLRDLVRSCKELFIVSDSDLNFVPFVTFPGGSPTTILGDEVVIHNLLSASDLRADSSRSKSQRIAVFADPDYDVIESSTNMLPAESHLPRTWNRLPGTRKEARAIEQIYASQALTFEGPNATKKALLEAATNSNILHIATHGICFEDSPCLRLMADNDTMGVTELVDFPLLRGSLVLAGANSSASSYLTAYEIAEMNLKFVDLVVLSACETGLGYNIRGEGLGSVALAFRIAGVKTVVASLWKIPDEESQLLMGYFYGFLADGVAPATALSKAQFKLRNRLSKQGHTHPWFWAGFVVIG